jgi:tetratricopeptide (TPR) repeat protein
VSDLLAGLLAALISTNTPTDVSNLVRQQTGLAIEVNNPNDPVQQEYLKLVEEDDAAVDEIESWTTNSIPAGQSGLPLKDRIRLRLDGVKSKYEDFVQHHPDYVRARLAYGSFLNQSGDTDGARLQWEKARDLDTNNPAAWNNLGNAYENGDIKKALECYTRAIELNPGQPVYYHNLAACAYTYRPEAEDYWKISEQEVYNVAIQLYQKAIRLDPENFVLATDYAECFYGISPPRWKEGLEAWNQCLKIARDEAEREGVHVHLARIQLGLTHYDEARHDLDAITNPMYAVLKNRISRNLDDAVQKALTNGPPQTLR